MRLFRWHSLEYHTEFGRALDLVKTADMQMCTVVRKCILRDFVLPYLAKSKDVLELIDLDRFSPWTANYISQLRPGYFSKLRTFIMRFPYAEQQDIPYLWHPEAYGNRQEPYATQNPAVRVRYAERHPGSEIFYQETGDLEEVAELGCVACSRPFDNQSGRAYVHENCTPFGLEVCAHIAQAASQVIARVAPRLKKVSKNNL